MIFAAGVARGFADPANTAFEAQVVPKRLTVNASSWISSTWLSCSVIGPAAIGFIFAAWGAPGSYIIITAGFILSWIFTLAIPPKHQHIPQKERPYIKRHCRRVGFSFQVHNLSGHPWHSTSSPYSSAGQLILLPIYANDILHVGARGLGLLNAAPYFRGLDNNPDGHPASADRASRA